jgi:tetratricopeptide (TPR) repeat protein
LRRSRESKEYKGISLCLIAKNEEGFIRDCLASVEGFADELVVVDTGSSDATVAIAESFGAKVIHFEWIDDFAAARNAALEASSGEWILLLDCDERLVPDTIPDLLEAIGDENFDCGMIPFYSASRLDASLREVVSGEALLDEPSILPRLFRRLESLRWEGIVHEAPVEMLAAPDLRARVLPGAIVHYGDIPTVRESLQKLERNKQLLERRLDSDPLDLVAWVYLGEERYRLGDLSGALEAFEIAWEQFADQRLVLATGIGTARISPMLLRTFTEKAACPLMLIAVQQNRFEDAVEIPRRCREWGITNPTLDYLSAACFERFSLQSRNPTKSRVWLQGAVEKLKDCLGKNRELRAIAALEGMTSWRAANKLGEIFIQLGEASRALDMFDLAIELREDFIEPRLGRCEAMISLGRTSQAKSELQSMSHLDCADQPLLFAIALRSEGNKVAADRYVDQAYERVRSAGILSSHRVTQLNGIIHEGRPVPA